NAIAVDPNNTSTYYIGAPGGGVFKSTDAGATWTPLTDFISRVGASAIAIDPNNSNIVYVGTGDDDGGDAPSIGMLKSTDGGITFGTTGLTFFGSSAEITEIYINPTNSNELYIATNQGFYKSTNAGASVSQTFNGNVKDIKLKPGDANTIYLTADGGFYRSTNAGNTFTRVTSGLPNGVGRMVLAVTPANAQYVYILAINSSADLLGLYRSTDGGTTFTKRDNGVDILENRQGFYDLAMEVSTTDANRIYTGCLNVWTSSNGGTSFIKINSWSSPNQPSYTHADIHQIRAFGNTLFVASDGGIYRGTVSGINFTDLTADAQIGQFYRVAVSKQSSNDI
ncbi:MAG: glycosyl hydrolase, partial [Nonlabens sp.]|nr:glycosyl hydrolase [Nonlabens sp.]